MTMHIGHIADETPDKAAYIMADSGETITYRHLDDESNRAAQLFASLGLKPGDHIALLLENHPLFFQICWAAQRSGLYYTPISWRLQHEEVEYIVGNCEAKVFISSYERRQTVASLAGVDDLVGRSREQAQATIEEAGLSLGSVSRVNDEQVGRGLVIAVEASAAELPLGDPVDLVVSLGPVARVVPVPLVSREPSRSN